MVFGPPTLPCDGGILPQMQAENATFDPQQSARRYQGKEGILLNSSIEYSRCV